MKYTSEYLEDLRIVTENIPDCAELSGKEILITGASGLICSAAADILLLLNKERNFGMKIYLAGRDPEGILRRYSIFEEGRDYHFFKYDATKQQTGLISADYIIHGAGNADPKKISSEPVETMLANIMGLNSLFEAVDRDKIKRLLYISSSEIYGVNERREPYMEEQLGYVDILNPRSSYPSSKRAAETLCIAYSEEYEIDTAIVRPGHIYGPTIKESDSRASALFSLKAARGEEIVMKSRGEQLRSYCHVLDCASAILAVLLKGEKSTAYNISNPNAIVTIREMAEAFAEAGNVKIIFDVPTDTELKSYNAMPCSALNSDRLTGLGWKAEFDMKKGAIHTVNLLRENM